MVISIAASLIRNAFFNRVVSIVAWSIAALSILGLLDEVIAGLDRAGIVIGGLRITALLVLKTTALLLVTLWGAVAISNFLDSRLQTYEDLTPSIQVLLGKLARVGARHLRGADRAQLGRHRLLGARDLLRRGRCRHRLRPAEDRVEPRQRHHPAGRQVDQAGRRDHRRQHLMAGSTPWGRATPRSSSRDGREYLIPNEDFITQQVINWTFSNDRVRIDIEFGVSYGSDPHRVRAAAIAAAASVPRVLEDPAPICHLSDFGTPRSISRCDSGSAIRTTAIGTVRSAVMLALWDAFKRDGIEFPFPQRDVNVREPVRVVVERESEVLVKDSRKAE